MWRWTGLAPRLSTKFSQMRRHSAEAGLDRASATQLSFVEIHAGSALYSSSIWEKAYILAILRRLSWADRPFLANHKQASLSVHTLTCWWRMRGPHTRATRMWPSNSKSDMWRSCRWAGGHTEMNWLSPKW